jgi:hypothetical protein
MKTSNKFVAIALMIMMSLSAAMAQQPNSAKQLNKQPQQAAAASTPVNGGGTTGQLPKWVGVDGANTYTLGDSNIFEDKFGKVGIGTRTPVSPLTVKGMIETTLGGYKFPDGTVQTTAALSTIFHDATLTGNGTAVSPLGIANGGVGTNQLANSAVTANKIAFGQVVKSFNGLFDDVTLAAGPNIILAQSGNTITIDTTGTNVPVPLVLGGSVNQGSVLSVTNTAARGFGVIAKGGKYSVLGNERGGGLLAQGADNPANSSDHAGIGLQALGGSNHSMDGKLAGTGIITNGGNCDSFPDCTPGIGIEAAAGFRPDGQKSRAGVFSGHVQIFGDLNASGTKNFKIDHPLDPANKYLYHAAIESSEVLNIYSGNITTDDNGDASVKLPEWFESLNRDFRYQLTVIGSFNQAIVANKIKDNTFTIKTNGAKVEVSWQVTGVRNDAAMKAQPFQVEEEKPVQERGYYITPEAHNQPLEKGLEYQHNPELLRQIKEVRSKVRKEKLQ